MFGLDLADKVKSLEPLLAPDGGKPVQAYEAQLPLLIASVAKAYCEFDHPEEAMQVLLIAKADLFERGPEFADQMQKALDKKLESSGIPKFLHAVPFVYSSKKQRRADEMRDFFSKPLTADEKFTMFQNAQKYVTVSNHKLELEVAMKNINVPLNKTGVIF